LISLHIDTARDWRGGQRQVIDTVSGLRSAGERAVLVAHPDGELMRRMSEGLDLVPLAPRSDIDLSAAWRLSRLVKSTPPDVIHAHDSHAVAMAATALAIAAPAPRPPLLASRRSEFRVDRSSFSRWKYSQVDGFVVASGAIRDRLVGDGVPRAKIAVVIPGVDVDRIQHAPAANVHAEFWLPTHAPLVGNVAALVPHKGHHDLVEAAALVVRDIPDARFVIVGGGELRPQLEKQIRDRHLERHVFLAGFRTDVIELTKGFDVLASSALVEGTSMAILDGMAAAKPVVATAAGSVPELVVDGKTGFVVKPRDSAALAERIVELLRSGERRQAMGGAGFERAAERFTVERMVRETMDTYLKFKVQTSKFKV
jgi:glycosyltransferase involved in cell wall biosynthesis